MPFYNHKSLFCNALLSTKWGEPGYLCLKVLDVDSGMVYKGNPILFVKSGQVMPIEGNLSTECGFDKVSRSPLFDLPDKPYGYKIVRKFKIPTCFDHTKEVQWSPCYWLGNRRLPKFYRRLSYAKKIMAELEAEDPNRVLMIIPMMKNPNIDQKKKQCHECHALGFHKMSCSRGNA